MWDRPPACPKRTAETAIPQNSEHSPFAETHEQLGGYFLVDARDLNEAINIAGGIPATHKGTVEIRPVMELSGLPENLEKNTAHLLIHGLQTTHEASIRVLLEQWAEATH